MPTTEKKKLKQSRVVDLVSDDETSSSPVDKKEISTTGKTSRDIDNSRKRGDERTAARNHKKRGAVDPPNTSSPEVKRVHKSTPSTANPKSKDPPLPLPSSHPTNHRDEATSPETKALYKIPELHRRFLQKIDPETGVYLKNPERFCIKPPVWDRWTPKRYRSFAEHLRKAFNPIHFAKYEDLPVEEVQQVFTAVVFKPLMNAYEARRRGEIGMMELFSLFNDFGTPVRAWGIDGKKLQGELDGVKPNSVFLVSTQGHAVQLCLKVLSKEDVEYLKSTLTDVDLKIFFGAEKGAMIARDRPRRWG